MDIVRELKAMSFDVKITDCFHVIHTIYLLSQSKELGEGGLFRWRKSTQLGFGQQARGQRFRKVQELPSVEMSFQKTELHRFFC